MIKTFDRDGVRFKYPSNWTLEEEDLQADEPADTDADADESPGAWTVTLQSPGTAFLLVALRPDIDHPRMLADETLEALKEEYPQLEANESLTSLAGQPAIGYDLDFIALDAVISTKIRSLLAPSGPVLFLAQFVEPERDSISLVMDAMLTSLVIDED